MKKFLTIQDQPAHLTFEMVGPSEYYHNNALQVLNEVGKDNLDFEIRIESHHLVSFSPFVGLGNGWCTQFGITFSAGDYHPSEYILGNGLAAVANFFKQISWSPYDNLAVGESAAMVATHFADEIATFIRGVALDFGRPVFPMEWTLTQHNSKHDNGVETLVVTVTPKLSNALKKNSIIPAEFYRSPREVINALVFYGATMGYDRLQIGMSEYRLDELLTSTGVESLGCDSFTLQASAYGYFHHHDIWEIPNLDKVNSVFTENREVYQSIETELKKTNSRTSITNAAGMIIGVMNRHFGISVDTGFNETLAE